MATTTFVSGATKPCCQDATNLQETRPRPDLVVKTCQVCGCRHFRVHAERGSLGAVLQRMGK